MPRFLVVVSLVFFTLVAVAQPGDPGGDPDVPISGIGILLGLGALIGIRKLMRDSRKNS